MPAVISIDDEDSLPVLQQVIEEFPHFRLNLPQSRQILYSSDLRALHEHLAKSELAPTVLLVDLRLKQVTYVNDHLLRLYPELEEVEVDLRDGTAMALAAIANTRRQELVVVITSSAAISFRQYSKIFDKPRESNPKPSKVVLAPDGRALFTDKDPQENIRIILKHAYDQWLTIASATPADPEQAMKLLARDLIRAQEPPMLGHPQSPDRVHTDLQLACEFNTQTFLESWKAMYLVKPPEPRLCKIRFFQRMLDLFNIRVKLKDCKDSDTFVVPLQPGILQVMCMAAFLRAMRIDEVTMLLDANEAELQVPLKDPVKFSNAVATNTGGEGTGRFYELLACSHRIVEQYLPPDKSTQVSLFPPSPIPEDDDPTKRAKVLRQVIFWKPSVTGLTLWWRSPRAQGDL